MDYYEELGLRPSASAEEIHAAYRQVARLLHPDSQQDPELRRLAERQMARLNEIAGVLLDPGRRRVYDRGLTGATVIVPVWRPMAARRGLGWIGIGAVGAMAGVCWLGWFWMGEWEGRREVLRAPGAEVRNSGIPPRALSARGPLAGLEAHSTAGLGTAPREKKRADAGMSERRAVAMRGIGDTGGLPLPVRPEIKLERPAGMRAWQAGMPAPRVAEEERAAPRAGMGGSWFYVPGPRDGQGEMKYAPEYIELTLKETAGRISGRYRGRYRVTDLAVSPEVSFGVDAVAGDDGAEGTWTAAGGAAGRIEMKAAGLERMQVRWWATENGAMNLVSGIATLVRRREP